MQGFKLIHISENGNTLQVLMCYVSINNVCGPCVIAASDKNKCHLQLLSSDLPTDRIEM